MKRIILFFSCLLLILAGFSPFFSQEKEAVEAKTAQVQEDLQEDLTLFYDPAGRRDPFRNLLGGSDVETSSTAEGIPQIYIDDVILIGIVRAGGKLRAVISSGQGFPYYIEEGEKFADGFVRLIEESRVIFRKTHERGIPLLRPKDVIKDIYQQEQ